MRVFVTGDAGFIGYHLSHALLTEGHHVSGFDGITDYYAPRLKRARLRRLEEFPAFSHVTAMLEDAGAVQQAVSDAKPDIVIHLAAQAGVRYSLEHPDTYVNANYVGTFNLINALRENTPQHVLLASSSSVYGGNTNTPFSESDQAEAPLSIYAATKKATEGLAHSYSHLYDIPITMLRFFTVYGPWGRPDMALFKFVSAIENGRAIDIYGHGNMKRDFTYVGDLVEAVRRLTSTPPVMGSPVGLSDSLSPVAPFRVVNIAGGVSVGLIEFIEAIENAMGMRAVRNMLPMQPGDVVETAADTVLLRQLVGEIPRTPVLEGVERFVAWYKEHDGALLTSTDASAEA